MWLAILASALALGRPRAQLARAPAAARGLVVRNKRYGPKL